MVNFNPKLYEKTDHELVTWALTIRDPLLTTDLEVELLNRFMRLTSITPKEAFEVAPPVLQNLLT